jgi:hypothetical protein
MISGVGVKLLTGLYRTFSTCRRSWMGTVKNRTGSIGDMYVVGETPWIFYSGAGHDGAYVG